MGLKSCRIRAGLLQKDVAEKLGVDASNVSLWETGRTFPRPPKLIRLAELYGCTVDDLLKGDEENAETAET